MVTAPKKPLEQTRPAEQLIYEQPLSERMRTLLRLEFLLDQAAHHVETDSHWDSRAAISTLLETSSLLGRGDVRSDVMKELERYTLFLSRLRDNPEVDTSLLKTVLQNLETARRALEAPRQPLGQRLKDSEFLNTIRNRISMPGGTCQFDLPGYHAWLAQPYAQRVRDLKNWFTDLQPLRDAVEVLMKLVRESSTPVDEVAEGGLFQKTLPNDSGCPLIRIILPALSTVFPEISGGRHRITIRFMERGDAHNRPQQTKQNIAFRLVCCQV